MIAEGRTFDPNRDATGFAEGSAVRTVADPLAFLVGRVEVRYGGDPSKTRVADLSPYIDAAKKTVKSVTGEIRLNYGAGVCVVNAPKAQGATGFLSKAGQIALADVSLRCANDYATIAVVSMDDLPLRRSRKVLVQVGTQMAPTGWQTRPATFKSEDGKETVQGEESVNTGKMPWRVTNAAGTITVRTPALRKATLLDAAGAPVRAIPVTRAAGVLTVKLPPDALYLVLE